MERCTICISRLGRLLLYLGDQKMDNIKELELRYTAEKGPELRVMFTTKPLTYTRVTLPGYVRLESGMEKYGVDEQVDGEHLEKVAAQGCPKCGAKLERHGNTLVCPKCGTEPFERE